MPEMSYPARQEKEISGFAEAESVCVFVWYWFLLLFCLDLFLFLPSHCNFIKMRITMT